jgi:hypothetical protein
LETRRRTSLAADTPGESQVKPVSCNIGWFGYGAWICAVSVQVVSWGSRYAPPAAVPPASLHLHAPRACSPRLACTCLLLHRCASLYTAACLHLFLGLAVVADGPSGQERAGCNSDLSRMFPRIYFRFWNTKAT